MLAPRSNQNRRRQRGFTLVELITVILIMGVLAAVALPRYADLQSKARAAKVTAVAGSMKAAASLVKATALANAVACSSSSTTVSMEGLSIASAYCYPQALVSFTDGILGAANVAAADNWTSAVASSTLTLTLSDAATPASCIVTYVAAGAAASSPSISTTTSGC